MKSMNRQKKCKIIGLGNDKYTLLFHLVTFRGEKHAKNCKMSSLYYSVNSFKVKMLKIKGPFGNLCLFFIVL